jgi:hypothetical protein
MSKCFTKEEEQYWEEKLRKASAFDGETILKEMNAALDAKEEDGIIIKKTLAKNRARKEAMLAEKNRLKNRGDQFRDTANMEG